MTSSSGIVLLHDGERMARHLDPATLPEDVFRFAQEQVDAGRFATTEDVLAAAVEALQQRDQAEHDWLVDARGEADDGFAALDRGAGVPGAAADLMARVDVTVRTRTRLT
jgi:Arc/MetJ-type ribon-helix-helix transcriptional regulator